MSLEVSSLRALAHPVRLRMLSLLTGVAMSAADLARELGVSQANASYHLRALAAARLVTAAGEVRVRGGVAKRYRYEVDGQAPPAADVASEPLFAQALAAELVRRSRLRRTGASGISTDAELWVDPTTWDEVRTRMTAASKQLHHAARPPRTAGTVRLSVTVAAFEMADEAL